MSARRAAWLRLWLRGCPAAGGLLLAAASCTLRAQSVESATFPSRQAHRGFTPAAGEEALHQALLAAIASMPEEAVADTVIAALAARGQMNAAAAQSFRPVLRDAYLQLRDDPMLKGLPSVLAYNLAREPAAQGHYYLYRPKEVTRSTPLVVFLHGSGGNFLFYPWAVSRMLPECVILFPSCGAHGSEIVRGYMDEMLRDARARHKDLPAGKPWLVGLSAGAAGAARVYAAAPADFAGAVLLGGWTPLQLPAGAPGRNARLRFIAGTDELAAAPDDFNRVRERLRTAPDFQFHEIPGDHFFLLREPAKTTAALRASLGLPALAAPVPPGAPPAPSVVAPQGAAGTTRR